MGVHGLWKLIESSGKPIPLEALENRVLAVDVSIWLYQLVKGFQEAGGQSVANAYLLGLFHRICKLLFYRIKPIFVFDGGVPVLKRRTIADRQNNRSKANRHGEKLRLALLENLAKQEALGQVLGESVVIPKIFQPKQTDTLFQLPPLPVVEGGDNGASSDSEDESENFRYKDIHSIDITSEEFLALPPDIRHDILSELKETRKQNSWGRLHLIPKESNDFSDYQMKRLLKRRAVQVGIEKAEGEMGTRGFTLNDLKNILTEQGVDLAQRIAADNSTRVLYRGNLTDIKESHEPPMKKKKITSSDVLNESLGIHYDDNYSDESLIDDPCAIMSSPESDEEELNQSEILQLIKEGSGLKPSQESPREEETIAMKKEEQLSVNGEAVENQIANNHPKLEHENFPGEESSCLISPTSPQLSSQPRPLPEDADIKSHNSSKGFENQNLVDIENNAIPQISLNKEIKFQKNTAISEKRLEVLNELNKVKQEMMSPLKAPIFPNFDGKNILGKLDLKKIPNSILNAPVDTTPIILKNSPSKKEEDLVEHSICSLTAPQITNQKQCIVDSTKDSLFSSQINDYTNEPVLPGSPKSTGSSEDSDGGFIEVNDEAADDENPAVIPTESFNAPNAKSTPSVEIVFNAEEPLEDDLFADVFDTFSATGKVDSSPPSSVKEVSPKKVESSEKFPKEIHKIPCIEENKDPEEIHKIPCMEESSDSIPILKGSTDPSESALGLVNDEINTSDVQELRDGIDSNFKPIHKVENPPSVPNFSVEEIMKMKRNLEKESSDLVIEAKREDRIASTITEQIRLDAQELLQLFGIPYIIAPMEAEAQCAFLDITGQTQGTITDDSDVWLFGGKNVYKNFFDQKKFVLQFKSTDIKRVLHVGREEMIMLALLTGSDYTLGLTGVGAVTALEVVAHYAKPEGGANPYERLACFANEFLEKKISGNLAKKLKKTAITDGFPCAEVINAYLQPEVDESTEKFTWSKPNINELRRYARDKFGWDNSRTDKLLEPIMENLNKTQTQGTLHSFFEWKFDGTAVARSKRVENAINLLKDPTSSIEPGTSRGRIITPQFLEEDVLPKKPVKSKTPAQIARERAAKKFQDLKKQGKIKTKSKKK